MLSSTLRHKAIAFRLVIFVSLIAGLIGFSPTHVLASIISSQKVVLVPNAAGQGCCAGVMPTSGTVAGTSLSFGDFQFTNLAVSSVSTANLSGYDTLVLLEVTTDSFTSQQQTDINNFVDNGGKLIIYDSDATPGNDYSWLLRPFTTSPPCPNCGLFGGTLTIVEDDTLGSNDSASPLYINTSEIPPNTDAVGDANVIATNDPAWFGHMQATNARGQTGWTHAYAESPSGKGVILYNGLDTDYIGYSYSPSGIDWLAKIWYQELKQQWDPTNLPGTNPIAGKTFYPPYEIDCRSASPDGFPSRSILNIIGNLSHGLAGVETATDKTSGTLGYRAFTWGGLSGGYMSFLPKDKNLPNQVAKAESCLGVTFTPNFTGQVEIEAKFQLAGKASAYAGSGTIDILNQLLAFAPPIYKALGKIGLNRTVPSVSMQGSYAFIRVQEIGLENTNQLTGVGASNAKLLPLPGPFGIPVFPTNMEHDYTGETVTVILTIDVQNDQTLSILAGIRSDLQSWDNSDTIANINGTKLEYIVIRPK